MTAQMDCFGATHVGQHRQANEDQFLIADLTKSMRVHRTSLGLDQQTRLFGNSQGRLLMVADGMGGHKAGDRASVLAVDSMTTYVLNTLSWCLPPREGDEELQDDLRDAVEHCQTALRREMQALPQRDGMGTTLTVAYVVWPKLYVVHVGDSRCYLFRNQRLRQLTRDHTLAELDDVTEDLDIPVQHMLWNVVGGPDHDLQPEVCQVSLELGDTLLLCTDGLTRHVSDEVIADRLAMNPPAQACCERFIDLANSKGGRDNVTAIVAKFGAHFETTQAEAAELELEGGEPAADTTPMLEASPT